jgi:hypothetical protein
MLLSARMLDNVASVNGFDWATQVEYTAGDGPVDVYFQLVDLNQDRVSTGFKFGGRRYAPAAGATLQVVLANIDDDIQVTRVATQPFTNDPSIWKVTMLGSDTIRGTCALSLKLTEGGKITYGRVEAAVLVHAQGTL